MGKTGNLQFRVFFSLGENTLLLAICLPPSVRVVDCVNSLQCSEQEVTRFSEYDVKEWITCNTLQRD